MPIPKNVAQKIPFAMISVLDGSLLTGADVTVYRILDGGVQSLASGSVNEIGNGNKLDASSLFASHVEAKTTFVLARVGYE